MRTTDRIRQQIAENPIILYMKGTPEMPRCGFSAKAVTALKTTGIDFAFVDVLAAPMIMEGLPEVTQFPTFPQLIIKGEIVGGSDIIEEMLANGELVPMLQSAAS